MSVLVGFAPTPEGRAALERGVAECRLRGSDLAVLVSQPRPTSVLGPDGDAPPPESPPAPDLAALMSELGAADLAGRVQEADPQRELADQMLEFAEEASIDLIVIGLRRRGPAGKLILGSSAQRIMLEAVCPVLAVKVDHRPAPRMAPDGVDAATPQAV